jgi:hypothetical protein
MKKCLTRSRGFNFTFTMPSKDCVENLEEQFEDDVGKDAHN